MTCECDTEFCYGCGQEFGHDNSCGCPSTVDEDGWNHRVGEDDADIEHGQAGGDESVTEDLADDADNVEDVDDSIQDEQLALHAEAPAPGGGW